MGQPSSRSYVGYGNASEQGNISDTIKVSPVVEKDATCHHRQK